MLDLKTIILKYINNEDDYMTFLKKNIYNSPLIHTPFGERHVVYADHTASGQPFVHIEKYIADNIYPYYANTHSNAHCGRRMSKMIDLARNIVKNATFSSIMKNFP